MNKTEHQDTALRLAMSVEEAAAAAGVGRTLIFNEIKTGRLIARKARGRTIVPAAALQAWLDSLPTVAESAAA